MSRPSAALRDANGSFVNPWIEHTPGGDRRAMLRWSWQRLREGTPERPPEGVLEVVRPDIARPAADPPETRVTWIGQASFLIQTGGLNLLTDPVFSQRASPVQWVGPKRLVPPGVALDELPRIDAVLLSHDHYDHLDVGSVRGLSERFGDALRWYTPLGYRAWFERLGVHNVVELDWWQEVAEEDERGSALRLTALPVQHWTRRAPGVSRRLWCSWAVRTDTMRLYFAGDSGYCPAFGEIGERLGPFDVSLLPIGAYEPRWFMKAAHMNPEDAVQAYLDLGGQGAFIGMHWGTFILTDEPVLEPPERTREVWARHGLPAEDLRLLRHGETGRFEGVRAWS